MAAGTEAPSPPTVHGNGAGRRVRIAVVGSGVAGIVASHVLSREHDVTLIEREDRIGGHTNTVTVAAGEDAGTPVDTGFIVLNDRTYPTFLKFLAELGVATREACMSFGFHDEQTGLQYAGTNLAGLFAQPLNALRPSFLGMVRDIGRFNKAALADLDGGRLGDVTLADYVAAGAYRRPFVENYLVPMGAAIWSTPADEMMAFPATVFIRFFKNHGLLTLGDRPTWRTVVGGSHSYLKAFTASFPGTIRTGERLACIRRTDDGATLRFDDGHEESFDRIVIATHADQALALLADPTDDEKRLLGPWGYQKNHTVLHRDSSVLPPNKRAWASWNYTREDSSRRDGTMSLTYHMNRLQGLPAAKNDWCVTLNRAKPVASGTMEAEFHYEHPTFTREAAAAQAELPSLNGVRNTWFCGSYFGFGFHEDAVKAGAAVGASMGLAL